MGVWAVSTSWQLWRTLQPPVSWVLSHKRIVFAALGWGLWWPLLCLPRQEMQGVPQFPQNHPKSFITWNLWPALPCSVYGLLLAGLPRWLIGKESTCQSRGLRFDPWVRKIPWRRKWEPTPVFLPGKSHGQRSLVVCNGPWGSKELDRTEWLGMHTHTTSCCQESVHQVKQGVWIFSGFPHPGGPNYEPWGSRGESIWPSHSQTQPRGPQEAWEGQQPPQGQDHLI